MARYINSYSTAADVQSAIDAGTLNKPYVAYLQDEDRIDWNSVVPIEEMPLTFEIISGGTIAWQGPTITPIEKNINNTGWSTVEMNEGNNAFTLNVNAGDVVQFRGNNNIYTGSLTTNGFTPSTSTFNVYGNIMSLINSTGYTTATTVTGNYCLASLFSSTKVVNASNLVLPATTLSYNCYYGMFQRCNSLTGAPSILPATALANSCYSGMFWACSSLTTAPVLPATTLTPNCYGYMFRFCNKLNYIKCLATNISALDCTEKWVEGVQTNSGTFVTPASTNWSTGTSGIPSGWTRVDA